jgi:murein L,D-transpeptidase YafK
MSVLEPKYANRQIWHYQGGNIQVLEEELVFTNPAHDDVKDALASAVDFAVAPINIFSIKKSQEQPMQFNQRFGGMQ